MEDKTPSNGNKKEKNNQGATKIDCAKPKESLDKILNYNCGAFSNDTIYDEDGKRAEIVHDIKKIDNGNGAGSDY